MNYIKHIARPLPVIATACLLAACSSTPGISLGGGAAPQIAAPGNNGSTGCSPSSGAVGGISTGSKPKTAGTSIGTSSKKKPARATSSTPQSGAAGSFSSANSGC